MTLAAVQRSFGDYLRDRPSDIAAHLDTAAALGLAVYHNAYRAQLVACLGDSYERTRQWLGGDAFAAAALTHVAAVPPSGWTLGDYGGEFPRTLWALYPEDPEVAEIAGIDWALRRAFDGPDADPVTAASLADVDWDRAVLTLAPTFSTLAITTNAAAIWTAMAAETDPPGAERLPAPVAIRIWRQGLSPQFITIDPIEAEALASVQSGATFAGLCDALSRSLGVEAAVERAGALLGVWLGDGLIVAIDD